MAFERIENHAQRMAGLLLFQFRGDGENDTRLQMLVKSMGAGVQTLEDETYAVATERWIDTAVGQQLDGLGEILGEPRFGRGDETYRLWLRFRIFINSAKATPENIIEATRFVSNEGEPGGRVQYWENYPASFELFTDGPFIPELFDATKTVLLVLDDGANLDFDDGDLLAVNPGNPEQLNTLLELLRSIAPIAVGRIAVTHSRGVPAAEVFAFAGEFVLNDFTLEDGSLLEFDDGTTLEVSVLETGESEGLGFAELQSVQFLLEDGSPLAFDDESELYVIDQTDPQIDGEGAGVYAEVIQELLQYAD